MRYRPTIPLLVTWMAPCAALGETSFVAKTPAEAVEMAIQHSGAEGRFSSSDLAARSFPGMPAPSDGITFVAKPIGASVSARSTYAPEDLSHREAPGVRGDETRLGGGGVPIALVARKSGRILAERVYVFERGDRVDVVVAARTIEVGETIRIGDLRVESVPYARSNDGCAKRFEEVIGRVAARRIGEGAPIAARSLRAELAVKRGDRVVVRALAGGLAVTLRANAVENGSLGDAITFVNSGTGRTLKARVIGRGEAEVEVVE